MDPRASASIRVYTVPMSSMSSAEVRVQVFLQERVYATREKTVHLEMPRNGRSPRVTRLTSLTRRFPHEGNEMRFSSCLGSLRRWSFSLTIVMFAPYRLLRFVRFRLSGVETLDCNLWGTSAWILGPAIGLGATQDQFEALNRPDEYQGRVLSRSGRARCLTVRAYASAQGYSHSTWFPISFRPHEMRVREGNCINSLRQWTVARHLRTAGRADEAPSDAKAQSIAGQYSARRGTSSADSPVRDDPHAVPSRICAAKAGCPVRRPIRREGHCRASLALMASCWQADTGGCAEHATANLEASRQIHRKGTTWFGSADSDRLQPHLPPRIDLQASQASLPFTRALRRQRRLRKARGLGAAPKGHDIRRPFRHRNRGNRGGCWLSSTLSTKRHKRPSGVAEGLCDGSGGAERRRDRADEARLRHAFPSHALPQGRVVAPDASYRRSRPSPATLRSSRQAQAARPETHN